MIEFVQVVAGVASTLVAVTALYMSFRSERRSQLRFEDQLQQSREIAAANLKPLLIIRSQTYVNRKGITLVNGGVGTAVITDIEFSKDGRSTRHLVELFDLEAGYMWDTFWRFSGRKYYLRAGEKYQLVEMTVDGLLRQGCTEDQALKLLARWQKQKSGIKVRVEYEDLLGNSVEPYSDTLN